LVACFGGFLVVARLGHSVWVVGAASRGAALLRVAGGTLAFGLLVAGSFLLQKKEHHDVIRLLETGSKAEKMLALAEVEASPALWSRVRPMAGAILRSGETEVRSRLLDLVEARKDKGLLPGVHALLVDPDDGVRERALRCV